MAGVPVTVQVMWVGTSEWVDLEQVVTDKRGAASVAGSYPDPGSFRFVYDGDTTYVEATSTELSVKGGAKVAPVPSRGSRNPVTARDGPGSPK